MSGRAKKAKGKAEQAQAGVGAFFWTVAALAVFVFWLLAFWGVRAIPLDDGLRILAVLAVFKVLMGLMCLNLLVWPWRSPGGAPPPPSGRRRKRRPAN